MIGLATMLVSGTFILHVLQSPAWILGHEIAVIVQEESEPLTRRET